MIRGLWVAGLMLLMLGVGVSAQAQSPENPNAAAIETLIEQASENGSTIVVIGGSQQNAGAEDAANARPPMEERAVIVRNNLQQVFMESPLFLERIENIIRASDPDNSLTWPFLAIALALLYLAIGYGIEYFFHGWSRPHFAYFCQENPENNQEKIAYLLFRGVMQAMALLIQGLTAVALVILFDQDSIAFRNLQFIVIIGFMSFRLAPVFMRAFLAPDTLAHRLVALTDEQANRLYRSIFTMSAILAVLIALNLWSGSLAMDVQTAQFVTIILTLATTLVKSFYAFLRRSEIASIILGGEDTRFIWKPRLFLARIWHVLAILYFVVTAILTIGWVVEGEPHALSLTNLPILAVFCGIAAYGAALLIIEWVFVRRRPLPTRAEAEAAIAEGPADVTPDVAVEILEREELLEQDDAPLKPQKSFKGLLEKGAGILISAFVVWWIFKLWGIDLTEPGSLLNDFWEVLLIFFFCYLAYESVKIAIDRKLEEEGIGDEPEPGEEGGATGASRLATLLPLFRNFLLIVIIVIGGMIMLSELGVDIAPLFAGAGVIGLAIGFGAQTLIRDIFSGAFFLMDDAFRKGEYISLGSVKGTVEKISIRSMQLRHHLGPLNTVPFGEIQQVSNFSRDWVMMKLPLRLTYDTDVEKVRKLIKKLGQELMDHPEVGDKFLQPLKSQGVFTMEDSAMIIRVKFMTKPGDQFVVRKLVYARIRELFEAEGIKFAHREVTVRVADEEGEHEPMSQAKKEAIAGAVQPAIEAAAADKPTGEDR
ncbi:MAG: mechanosensitive ion channel [Proteobacteria bacterium]|nr:mechanosensitive ion channel [Pseudomonadota bacterium]